MDFKKPKGKPEKEICKKIIDLMEKDGWFVHRLNVSAGVYSTTGFPDYYCTHLRHGQRWIEIKTPTGGLEISQIERFKRFGQHGIGVWILTREGDYTKLFEPPNWHTYCLRGKIR